MAGFKETFPNSHAVLPVIHVENSQQAIRNAAIAREAGADGVFLINMPSEGLRWYELSDVKDLVRGEFPNWWVGVNYLDNTLDRVFQLTDPETDGIWTDNAYIDERDESQQMAEQIDWIRQKAAASGGFKGLYFGGVAFKGQRPVPRVDWGLAANIASRYMDVVTTSGSGTGSAPDPEKIQIMKFSMGDHPLGIASGISPENVHLFIDADAFLVATSILKPHTNDFDPARVKALVEAVRG